MIYLYFCVMKYILSIFLIFYLAFKPLMPILDYAVNYEYISKVLCINKDKPALHCNGKCYVTKELAKSSQEDSSKTKNQTQKIIDFYIPTEISEIQFLEKEFFTKISFIYKKDYAYLFLTHIFHPPIF